MSERMKTWATITPAIIGLAGVLVGSAITTGTNYFLAVRKENAEATEHRLARASELKTAARLVANEFLVAHAAATILADKKRWMPKEIMFTLDAWQRNKGTLARELQLQDWNVVMVAALAVEHFRSVQLMPRSSDDVSDAMAESGKTVLRDIKAGLDALGPSMAEH
jgi:hypothetical protein